MSGSANTNDGLLIGGGADDYLIIASHRDHSRRMAQWPESTVDRKKSLNLKAIGSGGRLRVDGDLIVVGYEAAWRKSA